MGAGNSILSRRKSMVEAQAAAIPTSGEGEKGWKLLPRSQVPPVYRAGLHSSCLVLCTALRVTGRVGSQRGGEALPSIRRSGPPGMFPEFRVLQWGSLSKHRHILRKT